MAYEAELAYVRKAAGEVYTPEGVELWMHGRHRQLDGRTPTQAVEDGDGEKVLAIIAMLADGAFG